MTLYFSLAAFRILSLTFAILITVCLGVGLFGTSFWGPSLRPVPRYLFPSLGFGNFSAIISSNTFLIFSLSSSGTPIMQISAHFILSHISRMLLSFFFHMSFCLMF